METAKKEIYAIEFNGELWQSVFPSSEAEKSQLHTAKHNALTYMKKECGVKEPIVVINIHR